MSRPTAGSLKLLRSAGVLAILAASYILSPPRAAVGEQTSGALAVGEALYMTGDLSGAAERLMEASQAGDSLISRRAFYLLGRISLLTGDFRQAKEYFERAADLAEGDRERAGATAGIGDALQAAGGCGEAVRRYRQALTGAGRGVEGAVIELKIALCEHAMGREAEAGARLKEALERIPVLSDWVGREEEFYHAMAMSGLDFGDPSSESLYLLVGPVVGEFKVEEIIPPDIPVREVRKGGLVWLEFGPLSDGVEAMILSQGIRERFSFDVEVVRR